LTGQKAKVAAVTNVWGSPSFLSDDSGLVYTAPDPLAPASGLSLLEQDLTADRLHSQGPVALWLSDASMGLIYRRSSTQSTNQPPTVTLQLSADSISTQVPVTLMATATDPDGTVVSYAATGLPSGVTLNASTGLISGAAATGSDGVYPVTATVSDGTLTATRTFTWTVTAATVTQSPVIDVTVWTQRSTARTTIVSPVFSTAGSNELLLALVATGYVSGENTTVTGVEGAGLTWELVGRANGQSGTSEIWRAFAAAPVAG
jgi:hypothetical protein